MMDEKISCDTPKESKVATFLSKFAPLLILSFGLIAFLFLFGNVLTYSTKDPNTGEKAYFALNLLGFFDKTVTEPWIMIVILSSLAIGSLLPLVSYLFPKAKKSLLVSSLLVLLLSACFIFIGKEIFLSFAYNKIANFRNAELGWGSAASIVSIVAASVACLFATDYAKENSVRAIAEDGLLIAAAFVLNFIKIPLSVTGGSVNFQMLPLMLIALRRGPVHGFVCGGLIYGLLTCLTDGYGFATYPFDYLIGFGSVAVMGLFAPVILPKEGNPSIIKGILFIVLAGFVSTLVRFIGSTMSSMLVYGLSITDAMVYNAVYIPVSGLLAIAALCLLYPALLQINKRYKA